MTSPAPGHTPWRGPRAASCRVLLLAASLAWAGCSDGGSTAANLTPIDAGSTPGAGDEDGASTIEDAATGGAKDAAGAVDDAGPIADSGGAVVDDAAAADPVGDTSELAPDAVEDTAELLDTVPDSGPEAAPDAAPAEDTAPTEDTDAADASVAAEDVAQDEDAPISSTIGETCFAEIYDPSVNGPDYDQYAPVLGEHCLGTNHQDITGVEHVVILGDSVAQGTPNDVHPISTDNSHFWRNLLAEWAAVTFGLDKGGELGIEWGFWKSYDYFSGKGGALHVGDFSNCAKWGARTDDLLEGGGQIAECFPDGGSNKRTLIVFTMGGNDISKITQIGGEASPEEVAAGYPEAWALAESTVGFLAEALYWLKDPERFPNGSDVIFASPFEFTDGTGNVDACEPDTINIPFVGEFDVSDLGINVAALAGYAQWEQPEVQEAIVIWILEQYMKLAVETQTDLIWMLENFCGHGYVATGPDADVENRCYRGPDAELYFDVTCIHPSDAGHLAIFEMFQAVIDE